MKYYRLNQIAMAVLVALLLFFGARTLIKIAEEEPEPEKPGYEVAGTEEKKGEGKAKGGPDIAVLLAAGNAAHGADVSKKCAVCHSFDNGGPNLIGPNLYGVLGRKVASHEGYEYSDALKAKGGTWDYAMLDHMIENPNAFAPGTKMALFPGLPDAKERADVILFLREKNDSPPPLPEPSAAPVAEAPAEGEPAAGKASGGEILALIATADPKQGEAELALCKVCHTFDKGGATLIGPNLYGVVGKKIASHEGVTYTPALKAKEGDWTYENLDAWLTNPQAFAPGTSMAFPGLPDIKKRAAVIAYLRSNAESPIPLPEAAPAADKGAEPPAAPAEKAPAAPSAEEPAAEGKAPEPAAPAAPEAPSAKEPAAEAPAAPEAPAAEEPAAPAAPPAAKEPAAPEAPAAEEPAAPAAPPPAAPEAPAAEEPAAPAAPPAAEEPAAETPAAPEAEPASSEPSMGEPPSPSQPQPVYPDEEPAATEAPVTTDEVPAEAPVSMGEPPSPSQPQPVYPDGPPPGVE
jgi:cytochrome c2